MSEAPNDSNSPARIQDAESSLNSPEEQEAPQSPDSTIRDEELNVRRRTSAGRPRRVSNENRNIGGELSHQAFTSRNLPPPSSLQLRRVVEQEQSSASRQMAQDRPSTSRSVPCSPEHYVSDNSLLLNILTNRTASESSIYQRPQCSASVIAHQPRNSTAASVSSSPRRLQSHVPRLDVGHNPMLTNVHSDNSAANKSIHQRQQSFASGFAAQPSTSTSRSSSSSSQQDIGDPMLADQVTYNQSVNEKFIKRGGGRACTQTTKSKASAERSTSRPSQRHQVVEQGEQSSGSRQLVQNRRLMSRSVSSSPQQYVSDNSLLINILTNRTADESSINQRPQSLATAIETQQRNSVERSASCSPRLIPERNRMLDNMLPDNPTTISNLNNQRQRFSSGLGAQPSFSAASNTPHVPNLDPASNQMLTSMFSDNTAANESLNNRRQRFSSGLGEQQRISAASNTPRVSQLGAERNLMLTSMSSDNSAANDSLNNQRQRFSSGLGAQPSFSAASNTPHVPNLDAESNQMLTSMFSDNSAANKSLNNQRQRFSSGLGAQPSTSAARNTSSFQRRGTEGNQMLSSMSSDNAAVHESLNKGGKCTSKSVSKSNAFTAKQKFHPSQHSAVVEQEGQSSASKKKLAT